MELTSRQEAISKGLGRYFTGSPCKHGHITQRFTSSSGCVECVHPTFVNHEWQARRAEAYRKRSEIEKQRAERERLAPVIARMTSIFIVLHPLDLGVFQAFAHAAAMFHEPTLSLSHIETKHKPKQWGSKYRHTFLCFESDVASLRSFQDALDAARNPAAAVTHESIAAAAEQRLSTVLAAADAEASQDWPEENYN